VEFVFVRHGEGEHTLSPPRSLDCEDPRLTDVGRAQVADLRKRLSIARNELIVVSPTRRTIETAVVLAADVQARQFVSPALAPRMFEQNPRWPTLPCDRLLQRETLAVEYPEFTVLAGEDGVLWAEGINRVPEERFVIAARSLVTWCKTQAAERVVLISHDGTIHHYRRLLGEEGLTRASALGDARWYRCQA
jgi:broad specificity phosphatase PhoE